MKKSRKKSVFILFSFVLIIVFIFRSYFFDGKVPFATNLLVSFYSPWSFETFPGWEQGIPNKPLGYDNLHFFYPLKKLSLESLKKGEFPLWNPHNFSGNILLANLQSAIFYPLNILYFFIPQIEAWSLMVILVPLLSLIFMYLFLKELKLSSLASFFGSITWAFSGFFAVWMLENPAVSHSALWLPFILFSFERFYKNNKWSYWYLMTFALTASILGGHFQFAFYTWGFSLLYVLIRIKKQSITKNILPLSAFISSILLSSIQLFPTIQAQFYSARSFEASSFLLDIYLVHLSHLVNFVAPDWQGNPGTYNYFGGNSYYDKIIYIGIVPLILAVFTMFFLKRDKRIKFFTAVTLVSLLLGFRNPISVNFFNLQIPFLSTMIPSRIFFLTTFSLSTLSAVGFEKLRFEFMQADRKKLLYSVIILFLPLFLGWLHYIEWKFLFTREISENVIKNQTTMLRNLLFPGVIFGVVAGLLFVLVYFQRLGFILLFTLILLSLSHQYYFLRKNLYFSEREFVFPEHSIFSYLQKKAGTDRFLGLGSARVTPNISAYFKINSPEGLDPLFSARYGELIYAAENKGKITNLIPLIEVRFPNIYSRTEKIEQKPLLLRLLSLTSAKYLVLHQSDNINLPPEKFQKVWQQGKWRIYEYKQSLPRAFLAYEYIVETENQKIADLLFAADTDLSQTVILEEQPIINNFQPEADRPLAEIIENDVEIIKYAPNEVQIKLETTRPGLLFLSDNYYPGWKAYVDRKETKIYRANYSFRAIVVNKGKHNIVFSYEPESFHWGLRITLLTLFSLGAGYFILLKRK